MRVHTVTLEAAHVILWQDGAARRHECMMHMTAPFSMHDQTVQQPGTIARCGAETGAGRGLQVRRPGSRQPLYQRQGTRSLHGPLTLSLPPSLPLSPASRYEVTLPSFSLGRFHCGVALREGLRAACSLT